MVSLFRSLASVMPTARRAVDGEVLDARLDRREDGRLVYEITILSREGRYVDVIVDARQNRVVGLRRR